MGVAREPTYVLAAPVWRCRLVASLALLFSNLPAGATGTGSSLESSLLPEPVLAPRQTQDMILGVVTDQTMTRIGREFYQGFLTTWRNLDADVEQYNLAIYERPSARWGSLVWIEKDHQRLFATFIHPGRGVTAKLGEMAAQQVYGRIGQLDIEKQLFKDPDLGSDEW